MWGPGHLAWPLEPGSPAAYVPKGTQMSYRIQSKVVQGASIDVQMHGNASEIHTADTFEQKKKRLIFRYVFPLVALRRRGS